MNNKILGRIITGILVCLAVVCMINGTFGLYFFHITYGPVQNFFVDLGVYRVGGDVIRDGGSLYVNFPVTGHGNEALPFTYPPFAALIFTPITYFPWPILIGVITVFNLLCLGYVCYLVLVAVTQKRVRFIHVMLVCAILCFTDPVSQALSFGQINLLLLALVCSDAFLPKTLLPRGVLIGIAAAIKLTPIVFVAYYVVKKDYRTAITSMVSFIIASLLAVMVAPRDSILYFTNVLYHTDRIGPMSSWSNQSCLGFFTRITGDEHLSKIFWLVSCAVLVPLIIYAVKVLIDHNWNVEAISICSFLWLLCSPVAWNHHWIWFIPAVISFGYRAYILHSRALAVVTGLGVGIFLSCILRVGNGSMLPYLTENLWPPLLFLVQNSYTLWAIILIFTAIYAAKKTSWIPSVSPISSAPVMDDDQELISVVAG